MLVQRKLRRWSTKIWITSRMHWKINFRSFQCFATHYFSTAMLELKDVTDKLETMLSKKTLIEVKLELLEQDLSKKNAQYNGLINLSFYHHFCVVEKVRLIRDICGEDSYEETVKKVDKGVVKAIECVLLIMESRNHKCRSSTRNKALAMMFTRFLEDAKSKNACSLCSRDFKDKAEVESFIQKVDFSTLNLL